MYLSELMLEKRLAVNPYEIHRHLWKVFPGMPDDERPFLFHVGAGEQKNQQIILMQSSIKPDMQSLPAGCEMLRLKEFNPVLSQGQPLRFLLCVNPVKRLLKERCRVPLIKEEEQVEWIDRKIAGAAELLSAQRIAKQILYFRKKNTSGKIETVTFTGLMCVLSSEAFLKILKNGIGPAKSFGCGLLSIAGAA